MKFTVFIITKDEIKLVVNIKPAASASNTLNKT